MQEMQKCAYNTITERWNADNAADNLILLSQHLINGENPFPVVKGPGSQAHFIQQESMLEQIREVHEI